MIFKGIAQDCAQHPLEWSAAVYEVLERTSDTLGYAITLAYFYAFAYSGFKWRRFAFLLSGDTRFTGPHIGQIRFASDAERLGLGSSPCLGQHRVQLFASLDYLAACFAGGHNTPLGHVLDKANDRLNVLGVATHCTTQGGQGLLHVVCVQLQTRKFLADGVGSLDPCGLCLLGGADERAGSAPLIEIHLVGFGKGVERRDNVRLLLRLRLLLVDQRVADVAQ